MQEGARSTPTRVAGDIAAHAPAVAPAANRPVGEQINHRARIGLALERAGTLDHRRVLAAATGEVALTELDDERAVAHALIDALATTQSFGRMLRAEGQTTVDLDDDGNLVEISPDGTHRRL